ncbi:MAG: hypothetical protein JO235_09805 [Chroococcidiopsidaceae cyanobacterium CP_BM_RX_35]|nr:hypothetical protein [Chroococcidiopsidaceae cyanobacterium CP_BM_RX_35]
MMLPQGIAEFLSLKTLKALTDGCFRDMQSINSTFVDGLVGEPSGLAREKFNGTSASHMLHLVASLLESRLFFQSFWWG